MRKTVCITKKVIAIILCLAIVLGNCVYGKKEKVQAAGTANIYSQGYLRGTNPFYDVCAYSSVGCTWYAWGRAYEVLGISLPVTSSAVYWYNILSSYYQVGSEPRANSIAVWRDSTSSGAPGHVAFVEAVDGANVYYTEGGWTGSNGGYAGCQYCHYATRPLSKMAVGADTWGIGQYVVGYVYLTPTVTPSVTNVRVTEQTPDYYTVACDLSNYTSGYTVRFATWTANNIQDDLTWDDATVSGNTASFTIRRSDHNSEYGTYYTHVYIYPNGSGTPVASNTDLPGVIIENEAPVITDAKITDVTTDSYKVTCTVSDNVGVTSVLFPTWTDNNGQDDLAQSWPEGQIEGNTVTYTVKRSEHNNEFGRYNTHIYAYDKCGNFSMVPLTVDLTEVDSEGWTYSDSLPSDITSDKYDIQYKNTYTKEQTSSPGNGWNNEGLVRTEYQDNGQPYWSNIELETSEFRTLIQYKYYHFCGASTGNVANFEQSGNFVHYDEITDVNAVNIETSGRDADNTNYIYYKLRWKSDNTLAYCSTNVTCDATYGTHGSRSFIWYRTGLYQDRTKVAIYKYTKTSDWVSSKDASAASVKYRYKLKASDTAGNTTENNTSTENSGTKVEDVIAGTGFSVETIMDLLQQIIKGIQSNCSVMIFIQKTGSSNVRVCDEKGNSLSESQPVGTGCIIQTIGDDGSVIDSAVAVIKGDTDGTGTIDVLDMEGIQKSILGILELTGVYKEAAMITEDETDISVLDMEAVQKDILGISKIK